jgi:AAA+ superfamily predicted ATPase
MEQPGDPGNGRGPGCAGIRNAQALRVTVMEPALQIESMFRSFCSLFYLGSPNQGLMVEKCLKAAASQQMEVCGYNLSEGFWEGERRRSMDRAVDPVEMLEKILSTNREDGTFKRRLFLLEHFDLLLENRDAMILTKLRLIQDRSVNQYGVALLGRPFYPLPQPLSDIPRIDLPLLSSEDILDLIGNCRQTLARQETERVIRALKPLSVTECENLLSWSMASTGKIDTELIEREKGSLLKRRANGLIEICPPSVDLDQVGGLDLLKAWLRKRGRFLSEQDPEAAIPSPKGLLLCGPPGCGKSYVVSALAGTLGLQLVKLNPSRLFSSLVGDTEQNLRVALEVAIALSPCIFWVDEFEKLFPDSRGQASDGGVLLRVTGLFLDFLQEERQGVFVCGTVNNLAVLPTEITRAGRFDAVFFVDLPDGKERRAILEVLCANYGLSPQAAQNDLIIEASEGFSGAELEQAVVETLYECADRGTDFHELILLQEIRRLVPASITMQEEIDLMRKGGLGRTRPASSTGKPMPKSGGMRCRISPV